MQLALLQLLPSKITIINHNLGNPRHSWIFIPLYEAFHDDRWRWCGLLHGMKVGRYLLRIFFFLSPFSFSDKCKIFPFKTIFSFLISFSYSFLFSHLCPYNERINNWRTYAKQSKSVFSKFQKCDEKLSLLWHLFQDCL